MGEREAIHNIFVLTSKCIKRFGLFDENIYPALCEGADAPACGSTEYSWFSPAGLDFPSLRSISHQQNVSDESALATQHARWRPPAGTD